MRKKQGHYGIKQTAWGGNDIMLVSTPISSTVGPTEGVSVFSAQGVELKRSGCCLGAAYARKWPEHTISQPFSQQH